ncbi:MAG: VCBS repeat-containing protein [Kofleriaceae bacterium]
MSWRAVVAATLVATIAPAGAAPFVPPAAPDGGGPIGALWRTVVGELEAASAARRPALVPPVKLAVSWRPRRLTSLDLGSALLALAAADLDGDGADELVALTEQHLIVLAPAGKGLRERRRVAVPAESPSVRPRDPVGVIAVVARPGGAEVLARTSTSARGARYQWRDGGLVEVGPVAGFPLCPDRVVELAAGRNYATVDGVDLWTAQCRLGLVDPAGRPLAVTATVTTGGALTAVAETRCGPAEPGCRATTVGTLDGVGTALAVDDVDRDGWPEVIVAGAGAPGQPDAVAVYGLTADGFAKKPRFRRGFSGGVVAVAAGDVDGDGDREVFAAVRLAGARKVDLWLLD